MITIIPSDKLPQGSKEWSELRTKYISATDAFSLLKGISIKDILFSKQNNSFTGNYWTERGKRLEPDAREIYSTVYRPAKEVGFIINDKYPLVGFSPDGIVGEDGLIEIKCFGEKRHFSNFQNIDQSVMAQMQYQLWVSERKWNTLCLYNPEIDEPKKAFLTRTVYPDPDIHSRFEEIFSNYCKNT